MTANFLTEDSYLGSINEPLTLNRYNYCISSYPNYMDSSGNLPWRDILERGTRTGSILPFGGAKSENGCQAGLDIWNRAKSVARTVKSVARTVKSFGQGVKDSLMKDFLDKPWVSLLPWATFAENAYNALHRQDYPNSLLGESLPLYSQWRPTEELKARIAANETRIQAQAGEIEDRNAYYLGRCGGDVIVIVKGFVESFFGSSLAVSGGSALAGEAASGAGIVLAPETVAVIALGVLVAVDGATETVYGVQMLREDIGRYQESRAESEGDAESAWNGKTSPNLSAGKNFKDHYIRHKGLLEKLMGKKYPKYKDSNNGMEFLQDLSKLIKDGSLEYQGLGTLKKGAEPMNIYRGKGLTLVTKTNGEFVTLLERGIGMDLGIQFLH